MKKKIVVISDCTDVAYNELYRTLEIVLEKESCTDYHIYPLAPVKNFSTINAAFIIRLLADLYGENAYFLIVVSSGKESVDRVFDKTKSGITFVGNNSGYLDWMIRDFGLESLYINKQSKFNDYKSYGGKYVQAPTLAKLVAGCDLETLGDVAPDPFLRALDILPGTVVHCDNFGLMKIKADIPAGLEVGQSIEININGERTIKAVYAKNMKFQVSGEWVLYSGSSLGGLPELGKVRCSDSARELGVKEGDIILWG